MLTVLEKWKLTWLLPYIKSFSLNPATWQWGAWLLFIGCLDADFPLWLKGSLILWFGLLGLSGFSFAPASLSSQLLGLSTCFVLLQWVFFFEQWGKVLLNPPLSYTTLLVDVIRLSLTCWMFSRVT